MFDRSSIYDGEYPVCLEDFCFLPKQISMTGFYREFFAFLEDENNASLLDTLGITPQNVTLDSFSHRYERHRMTKSGEPDWMEAIPRNIRVYIRQKFFEDTVSPFKIIGDLPYAKMNYQIREGGLTSILYDIFSMHRLFRVKQLGFLQFPLAFVTGTGGSISPMAFPHSRGVHQLDVTAIMLGIIRNNPWLKEHASILEAAACSHDGKTPAGGDTTKFVDPAGFDEELNFSSFFKKTGWSEVRKRFDISEKLLDETVNGKGLFGSLLDVADKAAYLSRDVWHFVSTPKSLDEFRSGDRELLEQARTIIKEDPYFCSIWESLWVRDNDMFFSDAEKLFRFMKMRVILFTELYKKNEARLMESVMAKKLIKMLCTSGKATHAELLVWDDETLEEKIREEFKIPLSLLFFKRSTLMRFDTELARKQFAAGIRSSDLMPIIDDSASGHIKSGIHTFKVWKDDKPQIFAKAYKDAAREISKIGQCKETYPLYLVHREDLEIPKGIWRKVKQQ